MPSVSRFSLLCLIGAVSGPPVLAASPPLLRLDGPRIDAVFKEYNDRASPGCALGIYQGGKVVYARGYGMADLNQATPITPATLFDVGSISKQFAAASLVLLANEGKLALTDDLRKYLPEIPDYGTPITLDHLLHHTSGLRDYNDLLVYKGFHLEDVTDDDDALGIIARQRGLQFKPGSRWRYSNTNYFLAALVVKRVTGQSLAVFAKERLFQPLGMTRSHFRDDHTAIVPGRATAYSPADKGGYRIDMSNWNQLGDGQVQTNVLELVRWEENFYAPRVGGAALVDKLQERGSLDSGERTDYGRGLFLDTYRGVPRVHHSGGWAGYRSLLMRLPEQHVSIAVLCNRGDTRPDLAQKVADVVLDATFRAAEAQAPKALAPESPRAPEPVTGDVGPHAGVYYDAEDSKVVNIREKEGALEFNAMGHALPLRALGGGRFEAEAAQLTLAFEGERMTLSRRGKVRGTYQRMAPAKPSAEDWKALVGAYESPELETTWRIEPREGGAVLKARGLGTHPLEPTFADAFNAVPGLLRFTRDGAGKPTGFVFESIRFERSARQGAVSAATSGP